jgi:glycosyltransferase involved in cell wall biosynthesis
VKPLTTENPTISVICCAHNEEKYVDKSMPRLLKALAGFPYEIIFVADRCVDKTIEKAKKYSVRLIEKNWKNWINSYAESLQTGYLNSRGKYIAIVDVDILIPSDLFKRLMPILKNRIASVDVRVVTYPDTFWNKLMYAWEKTYSFTPAGRGHYGGVRIILREALDKIGGFRDVFSVDTDVDFRLAEAGYASLVVSTIKAYHIRHLSLRKAIRGQIRMGQGRYMVGYSFMRTLAHSVFRLRPLVVGGWFMEWIRKR